MGVAQLQCHPSGKFPSRGRCCQFVTQKKRKKEEKNEAFKKILMTYKVSTVVLENKTPESKTKREFKVSYRSKKCVSFVKLRRGLPVCQCRQCCDLRPAEKTTRHGPDRVHFLVFPVAFLPAGRLYLRILCASILRFWLLEHTTATRSVWLGIATLRLKLKLSETVRN